jgi:hypothetical protein
MGGFTEIDMPELEGVIDGEDITVLHVIDVLSEIVGNHKDTKGGPGSGHHGHGGRPGQRGGSSPGGGMNISDYPVLPSHKEIEPALNKRKTEKSFCFDKGGNVTFKKSGSKTSIGYTRDEVDEVRGSSVHYHNHPSHEQSPTVSFSPDDLVITAELEIGEARVISGGYRYRIIGAPDNLRKMAGDGDRRARPYLSLARQYSRQYNYEKARQAADTYNDWHSRWEELAPLYDVVYVREKIDETE